MKREEGGGGEERQEGESRCYRPVISSVLILSDEGFCTGNMQALVQLGKIFFYRDGQNGVPASVFVAFGLHRLLNQ